MFVAYRDDACDAIRLGKSVYPTMVTPLSVTTFSSITVPSAFPPRSAARSTITEPGFIAAIISANQSFGASRPGISAVVITISTSGANSRNFANCASRNSGLDTAAYPPVAARLVVLLRNQDRRIQRPLIQLVRPPLDVRQMHMSRPQGNRCPNRSKTRNTRAHNQNLGRWHFTRGSHLTREETTKVVSRFDHSAIPCDIRH